MAIRDIVFGAGLLILSSCGNNKATQPSLDGNFTGQWRATEVTDEFGGIRHSCQSAVFEVQQSGVALEISERKFICGPEMMEFSWASLEFLIRDRILYLQGNPAGTIDANSIRVSVAVPPSNRWTLTIESTSRGLRYLENITGASTTEARLERK